MPAFKIGSRLIGHDQPTYFIADIAGNHDGSLSRAKELIALAASVGADCAKFQHFTAETLVSDAGFKDLGESRSHQAAWGQSVFETYKNHECPIAWVPILAEFSQKLNIDFLTTPYSLEALEAADPYVAAYKIGSGDINWFEFLSKIGLKGKPVILATGASKACEVKAAAHLLASCGTPLALLQCNTNYTGSDENFNFLNLRVLQSYQREYPAAIVGLSDHTPGHVAVLGAVALGGRIIEKHFTDDAARPGPDHAFSLTPTGWRKMVDDVRRLEAALGEGVKRVEENERETVVLQRRCVRLKHDLPEGHGLQRDDLVCLRPAPEGSLPPWQAPSVLDKKLNNSKKAGDYLIWADLQ